VGGKMGLVDTSFGENWKLVNILKLSRQRFIFTMRSINLMKKYSVREGGYNVNLEKGLRENKHSKCKGNHFPSSTFVITRE
jgi:hypothetical protein